MMRALAIVAAMIIAGSSAAQTLSGGGTSPATSRTSYTATAAGTGYSAGDQIDRVVTSMPSSGAIVGAYWIDITQGGLLAGAPAAGSIVLKPDPLPAGTIIGVTQSGTWTVGVSGSVAVTGAFWQATQPISAASLPLPAGAATAAKQPATDGNGDLRVPTVTAQPFFVSLAANASTEVLAPSTARVAFDIQCAGTADVALSRIHATLTSATPSAGGADFVIPAGTKPYFLPPYVSGAGVTAYTTTAQACWGTSYARQ